MMNFIISDFHYNSFIINLLRLVITLKNGSPKTNELDLGEPHGNVPQKISKEKKNKIKI